MVLLIENCFHWIGFHVTNYLLEKGFEIDGIDDLNTAKKGHLSMFVGRNESFSHTVISQSEQTYDAVIRVFDHELVLEKGGNVTIKWPLIFGEWMPMDQKGIYAHDDFIPFDSDRFMAEAVYVTNVAKSLEQCLHASGLPPVLEIRSAHDQKTEQVKLENSVYIRNNRPIKESVAIVRNHYERYKRFY
ncbi:hypothetical protein [Lentibacillus salinarum]|uniref:Uncharacterized protein n=1 Tax=Lentibacillus salinarum TaxID=446820 RepID=A0ABW3ZPA9_9BACI